MTTKKLKSPKKNSQKSPEKKNLKNQTEVEVGLIKLITSAVENVFLPDTKFAKFSDAKQSKWSDLNVCVCVTWHFIFFCFQFGNVKVVIPILAFRNHNSFNPFQYINVDLIRNIMTKIAQQVWSIDSNVLTGLTFLTFCKKKQPPRLYLPPL